MAFGSAERLVEEDVGDLCRSRVDRSGSSTGGTLPNATGNGLPRRETLIHITRNARFRHARMRRRTPKA